jgi:rhodanese-related sulfurtransferase
MTKGTGQERVMADKTLQGANQPQEISAQELEAMLKTEQPPLVIDVREPFELAYGFIPGSANIPISAVALRLEELPRDQVIVTYCHLGERSWNVAQFLARRGFREVKSLRGGIEAWQAFKSLNK